MRVKLYTLIFLLILPSLCVADITGTSGPFVDGETVLVLGSGFGPKSPVAPLWEDWEWGSNLDELDSGGNNAWIVEYAGRQWISTADKYGSGTRSARWDILTTSPAQFPLVWKAVTQSTEYYMSFKYRLTNEGGSVYKFPRILADDRYTGSPNIALKGIKSAELLNFDWDYNAGDGQCGTDTESCDGLDKLEKIDFNAWMNVEIYDRLSIPGGTYNGEASGYLDGLPIGDGVSENALTRITGNTSLLEFVMIGWEVTGVTADSTYYIDDIYVDNTKSRVYLCDQSTLSASTHRELQIPKDTWGDGALNFYVNFGTFVAGNTPYLIVVDSDGVASTGFQVTLVDAATDGQPMTLGGEDLSLTAGETATVY